MNSLIRRLAVALVAALFGTLVLAGCSLFQQEDRVFDAFYDAEEIVAREFGADSYEMLHNSDLPFYTGDNTDHVVVYVNGEDGSKPFDRLWIIVSPETESEAIAVLEDFEAYLGDGVEWRRDEDALYGKEAPTDFAKYLISAIPREPWQRNLPSLDIRSHFTEDNGPFAEKTEVCWYARRYKTLVLVMDKVRYEYEIGGETYGTAPEEWETEKTAFDEFFKNTVDTDAFWE